MFLFSIYHPATTELYTLSLHDALPIFTGRHVRHARALARQLDLAVAEAHAQGQRVRIEGSFKGQEGGQADRKSTRLNSSHQIISYAVFCLKKKKLVLKVISNQYSGNIS